MKTFDPNYKLLDEMYQDDYYPDFLVDKVKDELQKVIDLLESGETDKKVIDLLESGETDTEVVQETLDEAVCDINDLQSQLRDLKLFFSVQGQDAVFPVRCPRPLRPFYHCTCSFPFHSAKRTCFPPISNSSVTP